ncbi:putative lipid II flippase FtsW [Knoellia subterranea]|uniref:Probable peptidoglycan glycosyltransferase FtsW n=1 Tax=Knoellia subterranea KCTC 19937 TaxID=1385521 RepID=A0A0A0JS19_9MICO|nr:putative lipid II flippase FtsW [Knoellia subterranea]KGN38406.1 cell division protein FtsW [Knoellia subterranea KCTC 19937]
MSSTTGPIKGSFKAPSRSQGASGRDRALGFVPAWLERLDRPVTTYYVLIGVTTVLVAFGLIMVLSASTVTSLNETNSGSAYAIFISQAVFAAVGGVALLIASRLSVSTWKKLALPVLLIGLILQVLVFTPLGMGAKGNRNWLDLKVLSMQPSELLKVGLALSGGLVLNAKRKQLGNLSHAIVPYLFPMAMLALGLVLMGHDLGTVLVMAAIVGGVLYTAGVPGRWFALSAAGFAAIAVTFVVTSPNRLGRFDVWLGRDTDQFGPARQTIHGRYALADGGWTGLGLGQSREKWEWLSEPHNDFIFAIIGEELGLPGTIMVLALFVVLALACYRLVMRTNDFFVRVATAGIMSWIIVQAMINIGAVIGLLPVIGVPLPFVSSGGSSLVTTMLALGILLSFARAEPGCAKALAARPSLVKRSFAVLPKRRSRA